MPSVFWLLVFPLLRLAAILDKKLLIVAAIAIAATAGAIAGDLMASAAKRRAGVKDYPTILPVQGGLLDIMDAWIVAGSSCSIYGNPAAIVS